MTRATKILPPVLPSWSIARPALEKRLEESLERVNGNGQIVRSGTATAGGVGLVDLTAGRGGHVIASVQDGAGNLRMLAYKVRADGGIERVGTGRAGEIGRIASSYIDRSGGEFLLTGVRDSENKLRMISWEVNLE